MITVFNDLKIIDTPFFKEVDEILEYIRTNPNKDAIELIRITKEKEERNKLKSKLKCICFSGKFSKRKKKNIIEHSGFACLDFDNVDNASKLREELKENEYIYSAFISPSGKGVKALVRIPAEIANHEKYYEAIVETFDSNIDAATKDVSRVCYESFDSGLWINHNSKIWSLKKDFTEVTRSNTYPEYFKIEELDEKVKIITSWFNKKFTLNAGERNNNLFKLAAALNKAGQNKDECLGLLMAFYSNGLKESEIKSVVDSAYGNTSDFGTLTIIDDNKIQKSRRAIEKGNKFATKVFKKEGLSDDDIEDVMDFDFEEDFLMFWSTDKGGKITLNDYKFKLFLENRGYYKVQLNDKEFTFVKVYNNIINEVSETHIKDFVLTHVEEIDVNVYNFFARATSKFTEGYLNQLSTKELTMLRDTASASFLFFNNIIVKITIDSLEYIEYINCGGLVWKKNIINKDFTVSANKSDFETFVDNISNKDVDRKKTLESSMGYLLNTHKKQNEGVAIILYDETLNDNPSGRTGKTVISKALGEVRKITTLNGKEFDNKGQFPYQTVNLDDNILVFDDLTRTFNFEALFSLITGDLTLNKKNLQPIVVPYVISPKILFTSNYILKGTGDSHDARKVEIELYRHYSSDHQPVNEFGKMFFSQWDENEWNDFFSYMIKNVQTYFKNGLIRQELKTAKTRKIISNTSEDFFDFCENDFAWSPNDWYTTKGILDEYSNGAREVPRNMSARWFGKWISSYFEYRDWKREDVNGQGGRKFRFVGEVEPNNNNQEEITF